MRLHQVLTGAANVLENSVAVGYGNTAGYPFTVYGSGYEVVILDSHFNRVQILSSQDAQVTSIVKCIACGTVNGKITASYGTKVVLFEPQAVKTNSSLKLPFHWKKITVLNFESEVQKLCWDEDSGRLLVGTDSLTMWRRVSHIDDEEHEWSCVWKRKLASSVHLLEFSPDGRFFASSGQVDCMIKIWFKAAKVSSYNQQHDDPLHKENYNFIYVLHPEPVQSFSWRKISKHMPICMVPNVLLTSCSDNVCRIWTETVKYKPSHHVVGKKSDAEEKRKERAESDLKHKTTIHVKLDENIHARQSYHLVSMYHFHLAAIVNPSSDIALLSTIPTQSIFGRSFQLQWLNNKEVALTTAVEAIYASLKEKTKEATTTDTNSTDPFLVVDDMGSDLGYEEGIDSVSDVKTLDLTLEEDQMDVDHDLTVKSSALSLKPPDVPVVEEVTPDCVFSTTYQDELNHLIHDWCSSSDTLYCIHPVDGSLLIWVVDFLDDFTSAFYRQVQVSFASRIPATFTKADATSLCWTHNYHYTQAQLNPTNLGNEDCEEDVDVALTRAKNIKTTDKLAVLQSSYMVSAHADGSLNLWLVTFSDSGSFMGIASITHVTRSCGPRFGTTQLVAHPDLPLVIGTSQRTTQKMDAELYLANDIESELILWHTHHVSPLSEYKGVTEMARISSPDPQKFLHVSWVPDLFQFPLLSITNDGIDLLPNVPSACFVAASNSGLQIYQILLDAKSLLSNLGTLKFSSALPNHMQTLSELIESEQSGSQSACIMNVCDLNDFTDMDNVQFLHVFCSQSVGSCSSDIEFDAAAKDIQEFFVVLISNDGFAQKICVWKIHVCFGEKFVSPLSPSSVNGDSSPMTPEKTSTSFLVNHCVKQELVYKDILSADGTNFLHFASAADLHSSSEIISSFPVKFHFTGVASNSIRFWELKRSEDNNLTVEECHSIDTMLSWDEDIVCLSCASSTRFAFISKKKNEKNNRDFYLHIKENETSGEEIWNTEYHNLFCSDVGGACDGSVKLSWLSLENGQYLLAVAVNNQVFIFCRNRTPVFGSSKGAKHVFHWQILKEVKVFNDLNDLFSLTTLAWTGSGFFMVGVENEIQVYSQWEDNIEVIFKRKDHLATIMSDSEEQGVILTTNSFTVACEKMTCLPQYHPDYLVQLLNLGKMRRIRAILRHLVRCVAGVKAADEAAIECNADDVNNMHIEGRNRAKTLTKTYSNLSEYSGSFKEYSIAEFDTRQSDPDIDSIPPLTLTELLKADKDQSGNMSTQDLLADNSLSRNDSAVYYSMNQARLLTEHLSKKHLPGLSSQEQMSLLALSDTIASSKDVDIEGIEVDENRKLRSEASETGYLRGGCGGGGYATTGATGVGDFASDAVDECGLRFLILLRHHTAILKSLSPKQKAALDQQGMLSSEYCWAFHSDCTEELLAMFPGMKRNEPSWHELRSHGAGWWIRSNDVLKRVIEKVAKTHFQMKKDPLDCAVFYLAMKKKSLLCALYRSLRDTKMSTFFSNDFNQERWRKAALKNAYALLGKQRFEHAAAFFLLGNSVWDAVQVCITRLNDIQLALVIARLFTNSIEGTHNQILKTYILGYEDEPPDEDPFKHSMAHWILKEYHESVDVFLVSFQENLQKNAEEHFDYPSIFNFYNYLRTHPLIRRRHLSQHRGQTTTTTSGSLSSHPSFSHQVSAVKESPQTFTNQLERSLCFHTACIHLNSGLPDIALEVLAMLPSSNDEANEQNESEKDSTTANNNEDMIVTGTFSGELTGNVSSTSLVNGDIGTFRYNDDDGLGFGSGWGSDDIGFNTNRFADLDGGYKISISLSDDEGDEDEESEGIQEKQVETTDLLEKVVETNVKKTQPFNDIAALNLKFRCIVQMLIEALKALPSKCALEKVKLRRTLKEMIRKELEYLHSACSYGIQETKSAEESRSGSMRVEEPKTYRSLSSISNTSFDISADDSSLSEKVEQISVQSEWLKRNQKILASLYEHCLMVGTGDPELPAVCVELLLLLHEIEDHRVLNSPLTSISVGPSAPPLLLASISSFSLVSSPVGFLQSMAHDLLQTVIDLKSLPSPRNPVKRLADLESLMCSLSSCIYHSLCGGDDDRLLTSIRKGETQLVGKQMKDGKLCRIPKGSMDVDIEVTSSPTRWPGVKFFLSILSANKKDEKNSLNLLLCEAAVAVYLSMFVSACSRLSCSNLYRFVLNDLTENMWNDVFGGGSKVVIPAPENLSRSSPLPEKKNSMKDTARMRWNYKLLGKQPTTQSQSTNNDTTPSDSQKLVRHELFIPPKISLCDYFLKKPKKFHSFEYDSEEEESDDEDDDVTNHEDYNTDVEDDGLIDEDVLQKRIEEKRKKRAKLSEHFDSMSYPWLIMKLALVELTMKNINDFISLAGLELSDLPTQSTLLYNATKILERWEQLLCAQLDTYSLDESLINFYPSQSDGGVMRGGLILQKTKILLDPDNTPFSSLGRRVGAAKRLWHILVQKELVRSLFLHYSFKSNVNAGEDATDFEVITGHLLHKDPEPVTNLCINMSNTGFMAVSSIHEIIEYDISGSMEADIYSDETQKLHLVSDSSNRDKKQAHLKSSTPIEIQRRQITGIRRMASHPNLPYYVTGGSDGSVRMFEFIHPDQITIFRPPGQHERVNKIVFNPMGNKFGAVDDSGYLSVWQVASTQDTTPFYSLKCHTKNCMDFAFLGSSSLITTIGSTTEKRNVCVWDTLLPPKKALVNSFSHGSHGAQCVTYIPGQQCIVTGGKRGDICIFDILHGKLIHSFAGHDSLIKTITLDPMERFFVTGSVDGDIKVWNLFTYEVLDSYPKEHARATVSLRQISPGVQCLRVMSSCKLFSCGGDGTVKWRQVRHQESNHFL